MSRQTGNTYQKIEFLLLKIDTFNSHELFFIPISQQKKTRYQKTETRLSLSQLKDRLSKKEAKKLTYKQAFFKSR